MPPVPRADWPAEQSPRGEMRWGLANAMTIDVEDYFHVEAFASTIDRSDWEALPRRVERNTERLLEILAESGVKATFFILGWVAERHPELVRRVVAEGHELASHGCGHLRVDRQSPEEFRHDVRRSKRILEDFGGVPVRGYRAPTFSIGGGSKWAHTILAEEGYCYSSSVYPVKHDLYGTPQAPRTPFSPVPGFLEIPLTAVRMLGIDIPASGGGYFRLLPYPLTRGLLNHARRVNRSPAVFYLHPWEIDPEQPRHQAAPFKSRVRHYLNLDRTEPRLRRLLRNFTWTRMDRLFLTDERGPFPVITSWTDRKQASP
ncbi:MAG TPA: XrtA system polysaccharide deacetylase [Stellaceae bacterium]|nr:XrtA system polysaccharide deacetylase [Stellaceae bacterium]